MQVPISSALGLRRALRIWSSRRYCTILPRSQSSPYHSHGSAKAQDTFSSGMLIVVQREPKLLFLSSTCATGTLGLNTKFTTSSLTALCSKRSIMVAAEYQSRRRWPNGQFESSLLPSGTLIVSLHPAPIGNPNIGILETLFSGPPKTTTSLLILPWNPTYENTGLYWSCHSDTASLAFTPPSNSLLAWVIERRSQVPSQLACYTHRLLESRMMVENCKEMLLPLKVREG
jgi:hypothetical protein